MSAYQFSIRIHLFVKYRDVQPVIQNFLCCPKLELRLSKFLNFAGRKEQNPQNTWRKVPTVYLILDTPGQANQSFRLIIFDYIWFCLIDCQKSENEMDLYYMRSKAFTGSFSKRFSWSFIQYFAKFSILLKIPNKHFGTKVRTMVRFFVPLWSQSSQQKAFPTEIFSKSKK